MKNKKISIIIPVYNEETFLRDIVTKVRQVDTLGLEKEIIIIDDNSKDGSPEIIKKLAENHKEIKYFLKEKNGGKGSALQKGFEIAKGDIILIQDADLEYSPDDYPDLLKPILEGIADVVYGSRFLSKTHRVLYYRHYVGNRLITALSNFFSNINLTDMETCYKVFVRKVIDRHEFKSKRFGFEVEFTATVSHMGLRIYEVPISYNGRTYKEGKKIGTKDAIEAGFLIIWTNLFIKIYNKNNKE